MYLYNNLEDFEAASLRILLLDDNLSNLLVLEKLLKNNGMTRVKSISDPRIGVETYRSFRPDLFLLDLRMPYVSGFEILQQLGAANKEDYLPIIVISAEDNRDNILKALELGAKDFIAKPFDQTEVMLRIRNTLMTKLLHNQICQSNHDLEKKVRERTEELEQMQVELIERLLKATEFRDRYTGKHITRIGTYVYEMAKLLDFSEDDAKKFYYASMMHDVGKIAIPDNILLKPEALDKDEYHTMKQHTLMGAEILSGSSHDVIRLAEQIASSHHEKWDGSGYPKGLCGKDIPLSGRMTAIFDVFDALLSKRAYKEKMDLDHALDIITQDSGRAFDPSLVQIFLDNLHVFLPIAQTV